MNTQNLLTVPQVAELCKVSQETIRRDIDLGRLTPSFRAEGKQRKRHLMTMEDVKAYQAWRTKEYGEEFDEA
ncbi:MAG: helix-turn-helix domain-containing protein [Herpetosiphonaceae bacterium]|nr:helix-turn-helix domain-containing protein [Herpetosiphonaceae bacterium]